MLNLQEFYQQCSSGEKTDCTEVMKYIKSFSNVIIWGGSYLGKAIGKKLLAEGISVTKYWDIRKQELGQVNGIEVELPFESEYDREKSLIIYSIGNHVIMGSLLYELKQRHYSNVLRGDIFYSGAICKFCNGMSLTSEQCWGSMECRPLVCKRAESIVKSTNEVKKPGEDINFTYIAFIVNNICNLQCKYCLQYINNYPVEKRGNVPLDIMKRDIDVFMNTIDSTGSITVMGGETFLHPQIGDMIAHLCKHKNFGFISIASNGLVRIKPEQLEKITDKRVAVNFGSYLHVASEQEKENYYKNVELVKSFGITCTESIKLPRWTIPSTLYKLDVEEQYKINRKQACVMPPRDLQIKNGKVHVCDMSLALHNMGLQDYKRDYMDLTVERSLEEHRKELRRLLNEPFYETCGHCNSCGQDGGEGGTQGKWQIFQPEV